MRYRIIVSLPLLNMASPIRGTAALALMLCTVHARTAGEYVEHASSFCSSISCHGTSCTGGTHYGNESASACRALCDAASCACYDWRDSAAAHAAPTQPNCRVATRAGLAHSGDGYSAFIPGDAPPPTPGPLYTVQGSIEVDTNENSLFYWQGALYLLENIPCYYSEHASRWDPRFANASYARIRRFDTGEILANISATIGYGFITPFVDELPNDGTAAGAEAGKRLSSPTAPSAPAPAVWLFGSACNRCPHSPSGPHGCVANRTVTAWRMEPGSSLREWGGAERVQGTYATFNVQVARVTSTPAQQAAAGLPTHGYVMISEISPHLFLINDAPDGNLGSGWREIPGANNRFGAPSGGPSIRFSPLDNMYYIIEGGHTVELVRTRDFRTWERSPNAPFIAPSPADGRIAPFNGFPAVAAARGFGPMAAPNTARWDWNSNDADVCCMNMPRAAGRSFVVWGAGTQGKAPKPPLTKANHCTNVVATANVSLPQLLAAHFQ